MVDGLEERPLEDGKNGMGGVRLMPLRVQTTFVCDAGREREGGGSKVTRAHR